MVTNAMATHKWGTNVLGKAESPWLQSLGVWGNPPEGGRKNIRTSDFGGAEGTQQQNSRIHGAMLDRNKYVCSDTAQQWANAWVAQHARV